MVERGVKARTQGEGCVTETTRTINSANMLFFPFSIHLSSLLTWQKQGGFFCCNHGTPIFMASKTTRQLESWNRQSNPHPPFS